MSISLPQLLRHVFTGWGTTLRAAFLLLIVLCSLFALLKYLQLHCTSSRQPWKLPPGRHRAR